MDKNTKRTKRNTKRTKKIEMIKLPRCKKCKALQIKIVRYYYEKCQYCNSGLENVGFKEIKLKK